MADSSSNNSKTQLPDSQATAAPVTQTAAPQTAAPQTAAPQTAAPQTAAPQPITATNATGAVQTVDAPAPQPVQAAPQPAPAKQGIFAPGDIVSGTYEIIKMIGKGGMGEVYKAKDKALDTDFALKVVRNAFGDENNHALDMLRNEAKKTAKLRHKNIVFVNGLKQDERTGVWYIAMEFVDGGNLRGILKKKGKITEEQGVVIIQEVASALSAAAELKIVHRDIKPDNIMFTSRGEVKLADLGIAKHYGDGGGDGSWTMATGGIVGTPAYLSPEQINAPHDVDIRSDIYCLGATFYEMLTGRPPFVGEINALYGQILYSEIPDPRKFNPEISEWCAKLMLKMLDKKQNKRFQTPNELVAALEEGPYQFTMLDREELIKCMLNGTKPDLQSLSTTHGTPGKPKKSKLPFVLLGCGTVALLGLGGIGLIGGVFAINDFSPSKTWKWIQNPFQGSVPNVIVTNIEIMPSISVAIGQNTEGAEPKEYTVPHNGVLMCGGMEPNVEYVLSLAPYEGYADIKGVFTAVPGEAVKINVKDMFASPENQERYFTWMNLLLEEHASKCTDLVNKLKSVLASGEGWDNVVAMRDNIKTHLREFDRLYGEVGVDAAKLSEKTLAFNKAKGECFAVVVDADKKFELHVSSETELPKVTKKADDLKNSLKEARTLASNSVAEVTAAVAAIGDDAESLENARKLSAAKSAEFEKCLETLKENYDSIVSSCDKYASFNKSFTDVSSSCKTAYDEFMAYVDAEKIGSKLDVSEAVGQQYEAVASRIVSSEKKVNALTASLANAVADGDADYANTLAELEKTVASIGEDVKKAEKICKDEAKLAELEKTAGRVETISNEIEVLKNGLGEYETFRKSIAEFGKMLDDNALEAADAIAEFDKISGSYANLQKKLVNDGAVTGKVNDSIVKSATTLYGGIEKKCNQFRTELNERQAERINAFANMLNEKQKQLEAHLRPVLDAQNTRILKINYDTFSNTFAELEDEYRKIENYAKSNEMADASKARLKNAEQTYENIRKYAIEVAKYFRFSNGCYAQVEKANGIVAALNGLLEQSAQNNALVHEDVAAQTRQLVKLQEEQRNLSEMAKGIQTVVKEAAPVCNGKLAEIDKLLADASALTERCAFRETYLKMTAVVDNIQNKSQNVKDGDVADVDALIEKYAAEFNGYYENAAQLEKVAEQDKAALDNIRKRYDGSMADLRKAAAERRFMLANKSFNDKKNKVDELFVTVERDFEALGAADNQKDAARFAENITASFADIQLVCDNVMADAKVTDEQEQFVNETVGRLNNLKADVSSLGKIRNAYLEILKIANSDDAKAEYAKAAALAKAANEQLENINERKSQANDICREIAGLIEKIKPADAVASDSDKNSGEKQNVSTVTGKDDNNQTAGGDAIVVENAGGKPGVAGEIAKHINNVVENTKNQQNAPRVEALLAGVAHCFNLMANANSAEDIAMSKKVMLDGLALADNVSRSIEMADVAKDANDRIKQITDEIQAFSTLVRTRLEYDLLLDQLEKSGSMADFNDADTKLSAAVEYVDGKCSGLKYAKRGGLAVKTQLETMQGKIDTLRKNSYYRGYIDNIRECHAKSSLAMTNLNNAYMGLTTLKSADEYKTAYATIKSSSEAVANIFDKLTDRQKIGTDEIVATAAELERNKETATAILKDVKALEKYLYNVLDVEAAGAELTAAGGANDKAKSKLTKLKKVAEPKLKMPLSEQVFEKLYQRREKVFMEHGIY